MTVSVPDTSVWIKVIRDGTSEDFVRRGLRSRSLLLASVVSQELYLGAGDLAGKRELDRFRAAFTAAQLIVTPSFDDWSVAGVVLGRYGRLHGAVDPRFHLSDVLILLCAAAHRATLVTWNVRDMERWNRMLPGRRRVRVVTPARLTRVGQGEGSKGDS